MKKLKKYAFFVLKAIIGIFLQNKSKTIPVSNKLIAFVFLLILKSTDNLINTPGTSDNSLNPLKKEAPPYICPAF